MKRKLARRCENQGKTAETRCDRSATPGHIYCEPCRLRIGGYDRYNPQPAPKVQTHYSSNQQE